MCVKRTDFLNGMVSLGASGAFGGTAPSSPLAVEATTIARSALPAAIFNHSLRTYLFAEMVGSAKRWDYDAELLYVASILHDTGLAPQYMSKAERFEVDGAHVAQALMNKHRISALRQTLVWDAITLHDSGGLARWKPHEVALVNAGVSTDFGANLDILDHHQVRTVLEAVPRSGFIDAFLPAVAEVARRKPFATGNCFVTDVGYRLVPGFHLDNFCDEIRDDPFKDLTA